MKKYSVLAWLIVVLLFSCKENKSHKENAAGEDQVENLTPKKIESAQELLWLQGSWLSEDKSTIETWAVQRDSLSGNLYSGSAKKIIEVLTIKKVGSSWLYRSKGMTEEGKNILLDLEFYNTKQLVFSNPILEYPNKVEYLRLDDKTIQITISGNTGQPSSYKIFKLD